MFPSFRQRFILVVCVVAGGLLYLWMARLMASSDSGGVVSIVCASSIGDVLVPGIVAVVVSIGLGFVAGVCGSRLSGVFVVTAAMAFAGGWGGTIQQWARHVESGSDYWWFALEMVIWAIPVVVVIVITSYWRDALRGRLPNVLRSQSAGDIIIAQYGTDDATGFSHAGESESKIRRRARKAKKRRREEVVGFSGVGLISICVVAACFLQPHVWTQFACSVITGMVIIAVLWVMMRVVAGNTGNGVGDALYCGVVVVAIGGSCAMLLMRTGDTGQVLGGLFIAFVIAGCIAHQMFPRAGIHLILFSPIALGIAVYACSGVVYANEDKRALLEAMYHTIGGYQNVDGYLSYLAFALPVEYVAAGVAGAAAGIGWSETIIVHRYTHHMTDSHGG